MKRLAFSILFTISLVCQSQAHGSLLESCPQHVSTLVKAVQHYMSVKNSYDKQCDPVSGAHKESPEICGSLGNMQKALESAQFDLKDAQYYVGVACNTCVYIESAFNDMYREQIRTLQDRIDLLEQIIATGK